MTIADFIMFLPKYAFLYLKYMKKYVLHNLCHNSRVPSILYIFVNIVYSTSCAIKLFERNKLNELNCFKPKKQNTQVGTRNARLGVIRRISHPQDTNKDK